MLRIRPFRAIRPAGNLASRVASVPYDVVDTAEARELAKGNPYSFLHVIRPEIDLPDETSPYDDIVYETAATAFERFLADGTLVQDEDAGIFLYRQVMNHRAQIGIVCCCHIDDYEQNIIKKHEKTRPDKEDDRTRHVLTLMANAGPVFLTFRDDEGIATQIESDINQRPIVHFDAPDGVTHTVWTAADPDAYVRRFAGLDAAYVADGHHRSASASRAGRHLREQHPDAGPDATFNWFLSVLFPASDLTILAYNRTIRDLGDLSPTAFLTKLGELGTVTTTNETTPERPGVFCFHVDGAWHRLRLGQHHIEGKGPVDALDVQLLQDLMLSPMLGIEDPRTDPRLDFVGGIRGTAELEKRVAAGRAAVGVSLHPTSIEQLMDVSDAGLIMPPKSTWFEPKLRSGLFVHRLT